MSIEPAQGTATAGAPPTELQLHANITGLEPGSNYGSVVINAPGASGAPKTITLAMEVAAPGEESLPDVEPGGLISVSPTATVEPQALPSANRTTNPVSFVVTSSLQGEGSWLTAEPPEAVWPPDNAAM